MFMQRKTCIHSVKIPKQQFLDYHSPDVTEELAEIAFIDEDSDSVLFDIPAHADYLFDQIEEIYLN